MKGKPVNLGDGEGLQVPCTLHFNGKKMTTAFKHRIAGCVIGETANCFVYPKKRSEL